MSLEPKPLESGASNSSTRHVRECVDGGCEALERVVYRYTPYVRDRVAAYVASKIAIVDAELTDVVVTETWCRFAASRGKLRPNPRGRLTPVVLSWLKTTALRVSQEELRRRSGGPAGGNTAGDTTAEDPAAPSSNFGVVTGILRSEFMGKLNEALSALSDEQRTVFVARVIEDRSADEVAESLKMSSDQVAQHLFKAKGKLKRILDTDWFADFRED